MRIEPHQAWSIYCAAGTFGAAVASVLAESRADCDLNIRPHFAAVFADLEGKDVTAVSREELKALLLRVARKSVQLLDGMK